MTHTMQYYSYGPTVVQKALLDASSGCVGVQESKEEWTFVFV